MVNGHWCGNFQRTYSHCIIAPAVGNGWEKLPVCTGHFLSAKVHCFCHKSAACYVQVARLGTGRSCAQRRKKFMTKIKNG